LLRDKPELAAPDGGNTAFFGTDVDHDGFPNFFGTSAAAPAAAGVAALLMEADPRRPAAAIGAALRDSARDVGDAGPDAVTGHGLIDPLAAIALLETPAPGDCNGDGRVTIDELVAGVRIALGAAPLATCAALDGDADGAITIAELIAAVGLALG
jgi:subtilisin family serine protease